MDLQVQGLQDDRIGGSIDELEFAGGMPYVGRCWVQMNAELMKQVDDLESTRELRIVSRSLSEVKESISESGFERADAVSIRGFTRGSLMQSSSCAGS